MPEMVDPFEERVARGSEIGFVYFVQQGTQGSIKIGWAKNPERRLKALQTSHPCELRIIGIIPGTRVEERALHAHFARARLKGEWFNRNKVLSEVMEMLMDIGILARKCKKSRNSPEANSSYEFYCCLVEV